MRIFLYVFCYILQVYMLLYKLFAFFSVLICYTHQSIKNIYVPYPLCYILYHLCLNPPECECVYILWPVVGSFSESPFKLCPTYTLSSELSFRQIFWAYFLNILGRLFRVFSLMSFYVVSHLHILAAETMVWHNIWLYFGPFFFITLLFIIVFVCLYRIQVLVMASIAGVAFTNIIKRICTFSYFHIFPLKFEVVSTILLYAPLHTQTTHLTWVL